MQSSRELTAKGIRVLEKVGRETLDMLAAETGFELEKDEVHSGMEVAGDGESFTEDVTFDRCFYVYGGPEHLEVTLDSGSFISLSLHIKSFMYKNDQNRGLSKFYKTHYHSQYLSLFYQCHIF